MVNEPSPVILAFLKAPVEGLVKTRLAKDLGHAEALRIYRLLVEHQLSNIPDGWSLEVHYHGCDDEGMMSAWLGQGYSYFKQAEGDLGDKLDHAFRTAFERNGGPCIAIGGDCPYLDEAIFNEAMLAQASCDIVIGPANDGGYYLIGSKSYRPKLFDNISWSTEETLNMTLSNIDKLGWHHILISALDDVDDLRSWQNAKAIMGK